MYLDGDDLDLDNIDWSKPAGLLECMGDFSIPWEDDHDAFGWLLDRIWLHPGYGLLVSEKQQQIGDFLLKCVRQILDDISEE